MWDSTLVGYFVGPKPSYSAVNATAHRLWDGLGLVEGITEDHFFFFFKFKGTESLDIVLDGAPWHVWNRPLVLKKWQPNLSLLKEELQKVPLWVRFYGIPLEFWTATGLSYIASAIGKPLHSDRMTGGKKRISYARICVEVDASKDFD